MISSFSPSKSFLNLETGQSEEEATFNLNAMNKIEGKKSWSLSFSFGRSLQQSYIKRKIRINEEQEDEKKALQITVLHLGAIHDDEFS